MMNAATDQTLFEGWKYLVTERDIEMYLDAAWELNDAAAWKKALAVAEKARKRIYGE